MVINVSKKQNEIVIAPVGRLDSSTSDEFSEFLNKNFTEDIEKLVLDFKEIDFISSKGLRVIVSTYKALNGRKLEIVGTNSSVMEIFRLSGLLKVLDVK